MKEIGRLGWTSICALAVAFVATLASPVGAQEPEAKITIESLLQSGWQIAGYTGAVDNWSTFILLRHPSETYLIQCRAGYDVTRQPRVQTNCYQLR
jgi:hypothetical protein